VALNYGIFRRSSFDQNPRYVCFIDVGQGKTSTYVFAFTKDKATMMTQYHDRDLGTRDFDWALLEHYCAKMEKENGVNIMTKEKSRMRMLDAIEKQRKVLSANSEASINVEYVANDLDFNHNLQRAEYEKINQGNLSKLRSLLQTLKSG
jgi:heat shock protein 4